VQRYLEHLAINDPAAPSGPPRSPSPDLLELAKEAFRRHTASLQEETSQPTDTPASKPASPPANKPASKLANLPARKPASEPASVPASEPAGKPADGLANKSVRAPASEPANQPTTDQPEGQLAPQPADQPPRQPALQLPSQPPQQPASHSASQPNNSQPAALVDRWELFPIPIGLGQRWAANAAPPELARLLALTWPRAEELEEVERRLLRSRRLAYYLAPRRDQAKGGTCRGRFWADRPDATSPPSSSAWGLHLGRKAPDEGSSSLILIPPGRQSL